MKRSVIVLMAMVVLTMFAGCGQGKIPAAGFAEEDLYLNIQDTRYTLGTDMQIVITDLGADYEYAEGKSCDYDGLDKTYRYKDVEFYTWPMPAGDLINEIYTKSAAAVTSKGISVNAEKKAVLAAYGAECEDTGYQLIYRLPDSVAGQSDGALCFDLQDNRVTAIYITSQPV